MWWWCALTWIAFWRRAMRRGQPNPTLHPSTCLLIKSNVQQSETTQAAATQYKYCNISMSFQSWQFSALHRWNFERAHACHASSRYTHAWVAWVLLAITGEGRRCSGILGIYMEQILEIQKLTVSAKLPLQQSCKKKSNFSDVTYVQCTFVQFEDMILI